jgi:chromosome partitioning protein
MTMLEGATPEAPTLGHVLLDQVDPGDAVRATRVKGLDILPADAGLADAAMLLADHLGREKRLRIALQELTSDYDFAVVDGAPHLNLVTINVLNAVDDLIVPVDAGLYSLAGLGRLQGTVDQVKRYLDNPRLRIAGLLLTRTHNNRATKDIAGQLRDAFGGLVYSAAVPHSVRVEEAHARHRSVLEFAPTSAPAKAYESLVKEVLTDGQQHQGGSAASPDADPADAA